MKMSYYILHKSTFVYFQNLHHGDMLYLLPSDGKDLPSNPVADNLAPAPCSTAQGVVEDEVDQILDKEDGKIYRKRNDGLDCLLQD
jgi:hypothetical protein